MLNLVQTSSHFSLDWWMESTQHMSGTFHMIKSWLQQPMLGHYGHHGQMSRSLYRSAFKSSCTYYSQSTHLLWMDGTGPLSTGFSLSTPSARREISTTVEQSPSISLSWFFWAGVQSTRRFNKRCRREEMLAFFCELFSFIAQRYT